ncbi:hypothetical protein I6A60_12330 [Frankia sp. AgB1.9]|nr:hypothetical protein [Frankia sp. AgB1.9]
MQALRAPRWTPEQRAHAAALFGLVPPEPASALPALPAVARVWRRA